MYATIRESGQDFHKYLIRRQELSKNVETHYNQVNIKHLNTAEYLLHPLLVWKNSKKPKRTT